MCLFAKRVRVVCLSIPVWYCMVCCFFCVLFAVFVCGVECVCLFHVFVGVVREFFCGDAWLGFVCVVLACVCSMFFKT